MDPQKRKEVLVGPGIVAGANALRAFDAPIRYPLVLKNYELYPPDPAVVPVRSIFIVLIEHLIGTILMFLFLFSRKAHKTLKKQIDSFELRDWLSFILVSLGSGLGLYFFMIAFSYGNPTVAILLQKSQPLITLLFAMAILQERPSKWFYLSLVVAAIGIYFMIVGDFGQASSDGEKAALFSLIAAVFWGSNTVWGRILTDKVDYWNLTALRYIGGSIILILVNIVVGAFTSANFGIFSETIKSFSKSPESYIPINGFISIFLVTIFTGGIIPLALYYFGLRWSRASVGGIAELAFPVLAVFVNYYFLGWGLSQDQIVGAVILIAVVSFMSYVNRIEHTAISEA